MASSSGHDEGFGSCESRFEIEDGRLDTGIIEGAKRTTLDHIRIQNPIIVDRVSQKLKRKSLKIDTCRISTGIVELQIIDVRLHGECAIQARFAFPVTCPISITFYGNSFASTDSGTCPWFAACSLSNSNIKPGVPFCEMKANLCFAIMDFPDEVQFRSPAINIQSTSFTPEDFDVWHCDRQHQSARLTRSLSTSGNSMANTLTTGLGQYGSDAAMFMMPRASTSALNDRAKLLCNRIEQIKLDRATISYST